MSTHGCHPSAFRSIMNRQTLAAALGGTVTARGLTRTCLFYNPHKMKGAAYTHVFTGAVGYVSLATSKRTYGTYRSYITFGRRHSCGVRRLSTTSGGSISSVHRLMRRIHVPPRVNGCGICVVSRIRVLSTSTFGTFLGALRRPPHRTVFVLTAARGRGVLPAVLSHYRVCSFGHVDISSAMRRLACITSGRGVATRPRTLGIVTLGTSNNVHSTLSVFSRMIDFANKRVACGDIVRGLGILSCRCCFELASYFLRGGMDSTLLLFGSMLGGNFSNDRFVAKLSSRFHSLLIDGSPTALTLLRMKTDVHRHCRRRTRGYPLPFLCQTVGLYGSYSVGCQTDGGGHLLMRLALVRITRLAVRKSSINNKHNPGRTVGPVFARSMTTRRPRGTPITPRTRRRATGIRPTRSTPTRSISTAKASASSTTNMSSIIIGTTIRRRGGVPMVDGSDLKISVERPRGRTTTRDAATIRAPTRTRIRPRRSCVFGRGSLGCC